MITDFLLRHAETNPISFHMPGHKGSGIYTLYGYKPFLDRMMDCDITEIPGADNLFQAEGIIRGVQDRYKALYDALESYLLINGTSGGLIAAILASVAPGGKLIMARNCHKAVFNALALGHVTPVFAYPETIPEYGIAGPLEAGTVRRLLEEHPDAGAVILPSPNYYGIVSDIGEIARVVHEAGKILIVDQAHGAHLHFFQKTGHGAGMPPSAESCGADIVVGSTHKTLASFTQSAVLHVCSGRVRLPVLEDKLQAIQSTSPSYILMASLDINAALLEHHGEALVSAWRENLDWFYAKGKTIPGLALMEHPGLDRTKINLDMGKLGISGSALEKLLNERGIFPELYTGNLLMCMTGIGNTRTHYEKLAEALEAISSACAKTHGAAGCAGAAPDSLRDKGTDSPAPMPPAQPPFVGVPRHKASLPLADAAGSICAASIIPYPPGIPLVCPGEVITPEAVEYLLALKKAGEKIIGLSAGGEILVGSGSSPA